MLGLILGAGIGFFVADAGFAAAMAQSGERKCGRGLYLSDGHCCARGTAWNGKRCIRRSGLRPSCPRGTIGVFPDCRGPSEARCPTGTTGRFPNCRNVQICPPGQVGAPPNCRSPRARRNAVTRPCPPGTSGVPPVCRRLTDRPCPSGMVASAGRCIVLQPQRRVHRPNLNLQSPRPSISVPRVGSGATARPLWR